MITTLQVRNFLEVLYYKELRYISFKNEVIHKGDKLNYVCERR